MAASFKIDQLDGAGEGVMGYARRGLWRDQEVTLTAYPGGSYAWAMLDKPGSSSAELEESELFSQVCHFTPDVNGTYRIRLIVGNQTMIRVIRVDRDSDGNRDGIWALPGFQEAVVEDNIDGNERGSAPVLEEIFQDIWDGMGGGEPSGPAGGDLAATYPNPLVAKLQSVTLDWSTEAPPADGLLKVRTETSPPGKHVDVLEPSSGYLQWTGSEFAWTNPGAAAAPFVVYDPEIEEDTDTEFASFADAYTAAAAIEGFPTIVVRNSESFDFGTGTYNLQNRITIMADPAQVFVQAPVETGTVFANPYQFTRVQLVNSSENPVFTTTTGAYDATFNDVFMSQGAAEATTWFAASTSTMSVVTFRGTGEVASGSRPLFDMSEEGAVIYFRNSWPVSSEIAEGAEGSVYVQETSTGTHVPSPSYSGSLVESKPALSLLNHVIFNSLASATAPPVYKTFQEAVTAAQALQGYVTLYVASPDTLTDEEHDLEGRIALKGIGDRPLLTLTGSTLFSNPYLFENLSIDASTDSYVFNTVGFMSQPPLNLTLQDCTLVDAGLTTPWVDITPNPTLNKIRLLGDGLLDTAEPLVDLDTDGLLDLVNNWTTIGPVTTASAGTSEMYLKSGVGAQYTQAPAANTLIDTTPAFRSAVVDSTGESGSFTVNLETASAPFITIQNTPSGDITAVLTAGTTNREVCVENAVPGAYLTKIQNEGSTKTVYMAPGQTRKVWMGPAGEDIKGEGLEVFDCQVTLDMDGYTVGNHDTVLLKTPALTVIDRVEVFLMETVAGGTAQVSVGTGGSYNQLLLLSSVATAGDALGLSNDDLGADLADVSGKFYAAAQTITVRVAVATSTLTAGIIKARVVGRYLGE